MKYKSALVTDLSGSIEGMTASRNKGGQYLRARVIPTNPQTSRQSTARQAFAQITQAWQALDESERDAWDTFAPLIPATDSLGQAVTLSGQQAYMKANVPLQFVNVKLAELEDDPAFTILDSPPANPTGSPTTVSPLVGATSAAASTFGVVFDNSDSWANTDEGALVVFAGQPAPSGKRPQDMPMRYAGIILGDSGTPPTSPVEFAHPFNLTSDANKNMIIMTYTIDPAFMPGFKDLSLPAPIAA